MPRYFAAGDGLCIAESSCGWFKSASAFWEAVLPRAVPRSVRALRVRHLRKLGTVARRLHRHVLIVEPGPRIHHCQATLRGLPRKILVDADRKSTPPLWVA